MLNSLLANPTRSVPVTEAALFAGLGFIIVFIGIAFLIFVVWAVGKFMPKTEAKKEKTVEENKQVQKQEIVEEKEEIPEETVAVIMAALMAYYQTNKPKCEFTVKRIKRI